MKPTPTPEMIEAARTAIARKDITFANCDSKWQLSVAEAALSAALSVPAAAVVGEPVAWTTEANLESAAFDPELALTMWGKPTGKKPVALYREPIAAPSAPDGLETIQTYYERQIEWSRETFGPALRTKGVLDHIRKELGEIEQEPHDLSEWVDVVILAMDGFWRHGGNAADLLPALLAKQKKNMARTWPDWRAMSEDRAIEHDRSKDAALGGASHE